MPATSSTVAVSGMLTVLLIAPEMNGWTAAIIRTDRKSTRLNSSHTEIYTLSLHDALPILEVDARDVLDGRRLRHVDRLADRTGDERLDRGHHPDRSEEHTSELQSHRDLHSFPTRRSSDLGSRCPRRPRRSPSPAC